MFKPIFTQEQRVELEELAKPLMKFLSENANPYAELKVTSAALECNSGPEWISRNTEFIED